MDGTKNAISIDREKTTVRTEPVEFFKTVIRFTVRLDKLSTEY
jgi:hypothetical protein